MNTFLTSAVCLAILTAAPALAAPAPPFVARAIADPARPKAEVATDKVREPADTLAFAGKANDIAMTGIAGTGLL